MPEKAGSYINAIIEMLPLFGLAFSIIFLKGLRGLRSAYTGRSYAARFMNVLWTAFIGSCLAVACAAVAPLVREGIGPDATLGIVVFIAVCGVRIVDGLLYKYLRIHLIDTTTQTADDKAWAGMSDEDKADAMQQWRGKGDDE